MKKPLLVASAMLTTMALSAPAIASETSSFRSDGLFDFTDKERWIVRGRALWVEPDESASISGIGGDVDIDPWVFGTGISYRF